MKTDQNTQTSQLVFSLVVKTLLGMSTSHTKLPGIESWLWSCSSCLLMLTQKGDGSFCVPGIHMRDLD